MRAGRAFAFDLVVQFAVLVSPLDHVGLWAGRAAKTLRAFSSRQYRLDVQKLGLISDASEIWPS